MSASQEPSDGEIYNWIRFSREGFLFLRESVKFYADLLRSDQKALSSHPELASLFSRDSIEANPVSKELKKVEDILKFIDSIVAQDGENAWHYRATMSHWMIRFLKSCRILYVDHLREVRNDFGNRPRVSKQSLEAVDQRVSQLEEATSTGVFANATPLPLSAPEFTHDSGPISIKVTESVPRPIIVDTIEIRDETLRARCLDLFRQFQQDGQNERLDTVVAEATRILEDRLRILAKAPAGLSGVDLAKFAFGASDTKLILSDIAAEQEAAHLLFRGVFGFIRNNVHHKLVGDLRPERVLQIVAFIDFLIGTAEKALDQTT